MDILMSRFESLKSKASKSKFDVYFLEELKDGVRVSFNSKENPELRTAILIHKEFLKRQYHDQIVNYMTSVIHLAK